MKKTLSLLLAFLMIFSVVPISAFAEDTTVDESVSKSIVQNIEIIFEGRIDGTAVSEPIPNFTFEPGKTEYTVAIPDTWTIAKVAVSTSEEGNGKTAELSINGGKKSGTIENEKTKIQFPTKQWLQVKPGKVYTATLTIGDNEEVYTFNVIRSSRFQSFSVSLDESASSVVTLSPTYSLLIRETYTATLPKGTESVWLNLTAHPSSRSCVEIYVDGNICQGTVGVKYEIDLNKYTPDENGNITIPVEEKYTGAEGTGQGSSYNLKFRFVDCIPTITKQPSSAQANKGELTVLSVDATCTEGSLTYQWYSGRTGSLNDEKPIDGATSKTIEIISDKAGKKDYICYVTNTLDGTPYVKKSNRVTVETNLSYITPAVITEFSGGGECIEGEEKLPLKMLFKTDDDFSYIEPKVTWYRNTVDSTAGGELIKESWDGGAFIPKGEPVGIYYYYCIVTLSDKSGKVAPVETVSNGTLTIVYKPYSSIITLPGAGTDTNPYKISTLADLEAVRTLVEQGYSLQNQHFLLTENIELPADWKPIGKLDGYDASLSINDIDEDIEGSVYNFTGKGTKVLPFSGIFNGDNHTITVEEGGLPLFGIVRAAEVKNLNIYGKKIAGYGLVHNYIVDYGSDGDYNTGCPQTIIIDNVTLKEGSATLYSGFIGGYASGANTVEIRNSKVEKGVTIGYDTSIERGRGNQSIGSFAGDFNGTITNCISYATVNGVDYVGGLVGRKGQSMGSCIVQNSQFWGTVNASGKWSGGILGSGYYSSSAPNTPIATVRNCLVSGTVKGGEYVGGIFGGEPVCEDCWTNGTGGIKNNVFYGTLTATGEYKGGIVGFMKSVNKYVTIENNYFVDSCGAEKAVGKVEIIDDKDFSDERCGTAATAEQMSSGSIVKKLNEFEGSFKNWIRGEKHPLISNKVVVYDIVVSGDVKKQHYIGDSLDLTGITITAKWTDGKTALIPLNDKELTISGYDANKRGQQTVTLTYGAVKTEIILTVLMPEGNDISVTFSLYGDSIHGADDDVHTLADNNLEKWIDKQTIVVGNNATVLDAIIKALGDNYILRNESGNYIQGVTPKDGKELAEFTNGDNSGWMYTLNDEHPLLGVSEQYLNDGDVIVFHYTDDYQRESAFDNDKESADTVIALINAIGTVDLSKEPAITAARTAYDALSDGAKALVSNYHTLTAAEARYAKLKDFDAAKAFDEAAAALPKAEEVKLSDKAAIEAVREIYNALTPEAKGYVNQEMLTRLILDEQKIADLEAAKAVDEAIEALPSADRLKLDDKAAVEEARSKYNALTPAQRSLVKKENADNLAALEAAIADMETARAVDDEIDAIDENAADKAERVAGARGAYNKLTDAQRKHVKKLARLEELEQQISDEEKAKAVEALISALPKAEDVKLGDEEAIAAAKAALDALSEAQSRYVSQEAEEKLEDALSALSELKANIKDVEDALNELPREMTEDGMEALIRANDDYEALSDEEKAAVDKQALKRLEDARAQAAVINHTSGNVTAEGLEWNVRLIATPVSEGENYEAMKAAAKGKSIISMYDISFVRLYRGGDTASYEPEEEVSIIINEKALSNYKDVAVLHEYAGDEKTVYGEIESKNADSRVAFSYAGKGDYAIIGSFVAPKTGDDASAIIYMAVLMAAAALCTAAIIHKKRAAK